MFNEAIGSLFVIAILGCCIAGYEDLQHCLEVSINIQTRECRTILIYSAVFTGNYLIYFHHRIIILLAVLSHLMDLYAVAPGLSKSMQSHDALRIFRLKQSLHFDGK